jgi:hypothetical protein
MLRLSSILQGLWICGKIQCRFDDKLIFLN